MRSKLFNLMKLGLSFLLITIILAGCSKETVNGPEEEPPILPPLESFKMEFSDFQSSGSMSKNASNQVILSKNNWGWAALNVGVWNTLITIGLAVPVGSFVATIDQDKEPTQLEDGTWIWTVDYNILTVKHTASLHGKIVSTGVEWEMYISKENVYEDFLWYTGNSNFLGTEGSWTLNKDPNNPTPLLGIEWHRNSQEGTADIKYINIEPDGPENGGYISYEINQETPYNAFYDIYNKGQENHTEMEWNRTSKDGRVKDPKHFGDTDWHLWNSNLDDV